MNQLVNLHYEPTVNIVNCHLVTKKTLFCPSKIKENNGISSFLFPSKAHREHMTSLTNQMLSKEGLSLKWAETILSIIRKISAVVRPDVRHENDDMDIRQYVQIKKVCM